MTVNKDSNISIFYELLSQGHNLSNIVLWVPAISCETYIVISEQ